MFTRKKYILIEPNDSADGSSGSVMRALDAKPTSNPARPADLPPTGSVIDPTLVAYQLDTLLSYLVRQRMKRQPLRCCSQDMAQRSRRPCAPSNRRERRACS